MNCWGARDGRGASVARGARAPAGGPGVGRPVRRGWPRSRAAWAVDHDGYVVTGDPRRLRHRAPVVTDGATLTIGAVDRLGSVCSPTARGDRGRRVRARAHRSGRSSRRHRAGGRAARRLRADSLATGSASDTSPGWRPMRYGSRADRQRSSRPSSRRCPISHVDTASRSWTTFSIGECSRRAGFERVRRGADRSARRRAGARWLDLVDARAESPLETFARLECVGRGRPAGRAAGRDPIVERPTPRSRRPGLAAAAMTGG